MHNNTSLTQHKNLSCYANYNTVTCITFWGHSYVDTCVSSNKCNKLFHSCFLNPALIKNTHTVRQPYLSTAYRENTYWELADVSLLVAYEMVSVIWWAVYHVFLWMINNVIKNQVARVSVHNVQVYIISYIHTETRFFCTICTGSLFSPTIIGCNFL
jgi:hypothetical protein